MLESEVIFNPRLRAPRPAARLRPRAKKTVTAMMAGKQPPALQQQYKSLMAAVAKASAQAAKL